MEKKLEGRVAVVTGAADMLFRAQRLWGEGFLSPGGPGEVCPSCTTRHMAETAAHLVDHVSPQLPVRKWVLALPKRLRYFVLRDAELARRVLNVWLRALTEPASRV